MLKSRVITAIILLALFLLALFVLPDSVWITIIILMVLQGTAEWTRLAKLRGVMANVYWWATLAIMLLLVWSGSARSLEQQAMLHMPAYLVSALLWLIIVPTWLITGWKVTNPILLALTGWAVLIPTGLAMLDLRAINPNMLLAVMGVVWVADIAAYFAGRKYGKRKLAPAISPGKTWEGVAGALLGVSLYVLLIGFNIDLTYRGVIPYMLLAAWWWVGLAVIGDLFESAIKRQAGVKDSGALLPGHGGLLDRIDALTSTLPLAALVVLMQQLK
jgi:phosphatidate cytidylyltransferase